MKSQKQSMKYSQNSNGEFVVKATKYCSKCSKLKNQKPYYGAPIGGISANRPEGVSKNEMNLLRNFFQFFFIFFLNSLEKKNRPDDIFRILGEIKNLCM